MEDSTFPFSMQEIVYGGGEIADGMIEAELDPRDVMPGCSMIKIKGTMDAAGAKASTGRKQPARKRGRRNYQEYEDDEDDEDTEDDDEEDVQDTIPTYPSAEQAQREDSYAQIQQKVLFADSLKSPSAQKAWETENAPYDANGKPRFEAEILTVVASVNLADKLDLAKIADNSRNVEYNPKYFSPLIMRVRDPKSTALLFASGKMIVAGTKTKEECKLAVRKYARIVQKLGYEVNYADFEVQNISASANLRFAVRVHEMANDERIKQFVSYEAEIFPGLVYSLVYPKVKAIIFVTGAVLMTGAKSEEQVYEALESIYPVARTYMR